MKSEKKDIPNLIKRYPQLNSIKADIINAYEIMVTTYEQGGKLLVAGNGGSAADAEHIAGELMKRFKCPRPIDPMLAEHLKKIDEVRGNYLAKNLESPLMAIPLVAHETIITAYMNDVDAKGVFAQQLLGYGRKGDVFLAITTSGNSENIIYAAIVAKALGIKTIGLTGQSGGILNDYADIMIKVPETETYKVQELHLPIYHCLCMMLEDHFFGDDIVFKDLGE